MRLGFGKLVDWIEVAGASGGGRSWWWLSSFAAPDGPLMVYAHFVEVGS